MQGISRLNSSSRWFFLFVAVVVLYAYWRIVEPYVLTVATAAIFAILFSRFDRWLAVKVRYPKLSAGLIVAGVFLGIFVPVTILAIVVVQQASEVLQSGALQNLPEVFGNLLTSVEGFVPTFAEELFLTIDFTSISTTVMNWLRVNLGALLAGGAHFVLNLFIFFAFLYYFLLHKDAIRQELFDLSPFKDTLDQGIVSRISATVRSVIVGAIIIAFIQATLAIIGLVIFGIPQGVLWGSFALIAAQIPMLGVGLVMIPAVSYLLIIGNVGAAIGLAIWATVVVGLVDNFLSPILIGRRTKMPELFVLLSVLGGLSLFGPIGFVIGPVVLACVLVLRDLYRSGAIV